MKTLLAALCALSFMSVAIARPVVIEESATLASPDSSWKFGRTGVAIDGDYALVSGGRVVPDPYSESGLSREGAAFLYRRSGVTWIYAGQLGPVGRIGDVQQPGLAMKNGVAMTLIDRPRIFERTGTTWTEGVLATDIPLTQGGDIEIDSGRILVPIFTCNRDSAVLRKINGIWSVEGDVHGNFDENCTDAPWPAKQDLQGERAVIANEPDSTNPIARARQYLRNENGQGWREFGGVTFDVDQPDYDVALAGQYLAITGPRARGTSLFYETQPLMYAKARYGLQAPDAYLEQYPWNATSIERVGTNMFAQRNRGFDTLVNVINVFRINDDTAHSSTQVATLQLKQGLPIGHLLDASGNRIIVNGGAYGGDDDLVRIFELPASFETPAVQVHDFESPSAGAAWQPAAGSSFSTVVARTTHVYRQASTSGNRSSWLPSSNARNQAIQTEVIVRSVASTSNAWVGLTTRRNGDSDYYYVALRATGVLELNRRLNGVSTTLSYAPATFTVGRKYRLRLESIGSSHRVYLDDSPVMVVRDDAIAEGTAGVMMNYIAADYDNVIVTPSPLTPIYKQNFSTPAGSDWAFAQGQWQTSGGVLRQTNSGDYGRGVIGARTDDQVVQARIRPMSFAGPDNWVGLMARYQDDRNYLYVSLRNRGVISLWRRTNGAITQLATASMPVSAGTWYRVRMEVVNGLTQVFVDNQLMLSTSADPGPTNPEVLESKGQMGLITYKATADFDDFIAYQP